MFIIQLKHDSRGKLVYLRDALHGVGVNYFFRTPLYVRLFSFWNLTIIVHMLLYEQILLWYQLSIRRKTACTFIHKKYANG